MNIHGVRPTPQAVGNIKPASDRQGKTVSVPREEAPTAAAETEQSPPSEVLGKEAESPFPASEKPVVNPEPGDVGGDEEISALLETLDPVDRRIIGHMLPENREALTLLSADIKRKTEFPGATLKDVLDNWDLVLKQDVFLKWGDVKVLTEKDFAHVEEETALMWERLSQGQVKTDSVPKGYIMVKGERFPIPVWTPLNHGPDGSVDDVEGAGASAYRTALRHMVDTYRENQWTDLLSGVDIKG